MNLDELAEQRLAGIPYRERGCYTKAQNAVRRARFPGTAERYPSVDELRAMTDQQLLTACHTFGPVGLASLRELLGQ